MCYNETSSAQLYNLQIIIEEQDKAINLKQSQLTFDLVEKAIRLGPSVVLQSHTVLLLKLSHYLHMMLRT
jgi:hypothetical protein